MRIVRGCGICENHQMWPYRTMIIVATPDQSTKSYGEQYRCQQLRELQRTNAKRTRKRPDSQTHTQNAKRTRKRQTNTRTQSTQNAKRTHTKRTDTRTHTQNAKTQNAHTRENDKQHTQKRKHTQEHTNAHTQTHTQQKTTDKNTHPKDKTQARKTHAHPHTRAIIRDLMSQADTATRFSCDAMTGGRTFSTTRSFSSCSVL